MKHTLSVLVEDESGVLTRIAGLFARRGFNIESLAVGPAEELGISRITMVVPSDERTIEQLTKQLYKLVNILRVEDITNLPCVERELMLIKIKTQLSERSEILEIAQVFRAHVVDLSEDSIIIEVTGDPGKTAAIQQFVSVGEHSFIAGGSLVRKNVPPYVKAAREPLSYIGVNTIGLRRRGFNDQQIINIEDIYRVIYVQNSNMTTALRVAELEVPVSDEKEVVLEFIRNSTKGIMRGLS